MLWAIGAAVGYLFLREWPQAAALALLAPTWLICQWTISTEWFHGAAPPLEMGLILTSLTYLSARIGDHEDTVRRTLVAIGSIALLPAVATAIGLAMESDRPYMSSQLSTAPASILLLSWTVVLAAPLLLAILLRGRAACFNFLSAAWAYGLIVAARHTYPLGPEGNSYKRLLGAQLLLSMRSAPSAPSCFSILMDSWANSVVLQACSFSASYVSLAATFSKSLDAN